MLREQIGRAAPERKEWVVLVQGQHGRVFGGVVQAQRSVVHHGTTWSGDEGGHGPHGSESQTDDCHISYDTSHE